MRPVTGHGGNRDETTSSALLQAGDDTLERQKRCGEIALHRCVPALLARLFEGTRRSEAATCIRYKDVDRAEFFFDLQARRFDLAKTRDIGENADRTLAGAFDLHSDGGERVVISSVKSNGGAKLRKLLRDARADSTRAPGHPCDFSIEPAHGHLRDA